LATKSGHADLFVNTFDESNYSEGNTLAEKLPKTKQDSMWVLENIRPVTSV